MSDEETYRQRYLHAAKRMQSGVAFVMEKDRHETAPKHLRVGVNTAHADLGGLAGLLIAKGVITRDEYLKAIAEAMEREADAYEQRLQDVYGVKITTGATLADLKPGDVLVTPTPTPAPVDRSQQTLTDGSPVTPDHREINPTTGQQKGYVVLSEAERSKGFVRPVRTSYVHRKCGTLTTMSRALAETYARDPKFYSGTFCVGCREHFPVAEFVWAGSNEELGS